MPLVVLPQKNTLPQVANAFHVRTTWSDVVEAADLVDVMAAGRTTLTKPDIAGCLELFAEEVMRLVADGKYVKTLLGSFYLSASGKLDEADEAFTPGEGSKAHELRLRFRAGRSVVDELRAAARVERGEVFDRKTPVILRAVSVRDEQPMRAAPGDFIRVSGQRLKFGPADAGAGLFFVNGSETRAGQYAEIGPSLVIAQVPPGLAPGTYQLALRSYQGGKELHEHRCATPFEVVAP